MSQRSEKPTDLVYRDYRNGDERQIVELMSPYWEHINNCNDWHHEFLDSPDGPCISRVCEINGRIIAHYGLIQIRMSLADKSISAGKGEGSVTQQRYRKSAPNISDLLRKDRSIFIRLSGEVLKKGIARDVSIMWGFPNQLALHGHLRAGWDSWLLHRRLLIRPVSIIGTARLLSGITPRFSRVPVTYLSVMPLWLLARPLRPLKLRQDTTVTLIDEFDEEVDRFWQRLNERHRMVSINRTCRHLNWRFAHKPYLRAILLSKNKLAGYAIGCVEDSGEVRRLRIIDLVIDDEVFASLGQLLGGLLEGMGSNLDLISMNCYYRGCNYGEMLNKEVARYFLPASRLHSQAAIIKVNPFSVDEEIIRDPRNWFISDVFREFF